MCNAKKIRKQSRIIVLLCFFYLFSIAQVNLIPNPSFEDSLGVPQSHSEFNKLKNWYTTIGTPDYYSIYSPITTTISAGWSVNAPNNCMGIQKARSGNFYIGIFLKTYCAPSLGCNPIDHYREAIGVKLTSPLKANHSYSFTLYYSLADASAYTTNGLDVIFSYTPNVINTSATASGDTTFYFNTPGQITHDNSLITDTVNWIPLSGCFIAKGGEQYVLIGHYKDALHSATTPIAHQNYFCNSNGSGASISCYIYIDDVSLYDMGLYEPAVCKNDTLICNGTPVNISANPVKDSSVVAWSPPTALSCTNCPNPVATPTTTTLYYVNKSICGANSKDSILVTVHTPTTIAKAGNDMLLCMEDKGVFIGTTDSTYFTSYNWAPNTGLSCTNCATPYANPTTTTIYNLTRKECNVTTTSTVKVTIDDCNPTYTVPNVFTPNYDGVNDTWGVTFSSSKYIKNFQLQIYDRWGLLIYNTNAETNTPQLKWDGHTTSGEECTNGVYYYIISFEKNGETINLKGSLSLFR